MGLNKWALNPVSCTPGEIAPMQLAVLTKRKVAHQERQHLPGEAG